MQWFVSFISKSKWSCWKQTSGEYYVKLAFVECPRGLTGWSPGVEIIWNSLGLTHLCLCLHNRLSYFEKDILQPHSDPSAQLQFVVQETTEDILIDGSHTEEFLWLKYIVCIYRTGIWTSSLLYCHTGSVLVVKHNRPLSQLTSYICGQSGHFSAGFSATLLFRQGLSVTQINVMSGLDLRHIYYFLHCVMWVTYLPSLMSLMTRFQFH